MSVKVCPSMFVHPGEWLRTEIVEVLRLGVGTAAARLGVSRDGLGLGGRLDLSAEMAIRFEAAFGVKADTLMRVQAAHDSARRTERSIGESLPTE